MQRHFVLIHKDLNPVPQVGKLRQIPWTIAGSVNEINCIVAESLFWTRLLKVSAFQISSNTLAPILRLGRREQNQVKSPHSFTASCYSILVRSPNHLSPCMMLFLCPKYISCAGCSKFEFPWFDFSKGPFLVSFFFFPCFCLFLSTIRAQIIRTVGIVNGYTMEVVVAQLAEQ